VRLIDFLNWCKANDIEFDPLLFAENLPGSAYGSHFTPKIAWAKLERHFGDRYAEVSALDPRQ
jgi:hypothetical protein